MDRKTVFIAVVSATVLLLAITAVTAHSRTANTPLYTMRMEQASSKMNFLPTVMNEFIYAAERGCTLNFDAAGGCFDARKPPDTSEPTCVLHETCPATCLNTCPNTQCGSTCSSTCPATCPNTCGSTCYTCFTCAPTCPDTCRYC